MPNARLAAGVVGQKKYIGGDWSGQRIAKNALGGSRVLPGAIGVLLVDAAEVLRRREKQIK